MMWGPWLILKTSTLNEQVVAERSSIHQWQHLAQRGLEDSDKHATASGSIRHRPRYRGGYRGRVTSLNAPL